MAEDGDDPEKKPITPVLVRWALAALALGVVIGAFPSTFTSEHVKKADLDTTVKNAVDPLVAQIKSGLELAAANLQLVEARLSGRMDTADERAKGTAVQVEDLQRDVHELKTALESTKEELLRALAEKGR